MSIWIAPEIIDTLVSSLQYNYIINELGADLDKEIFPEKDPNGKDLNSPGAKADAGKLRAWLVLGSFSNALEEVCRIGTVGANKYTPNGWVSVENGHERYMDAAIRHLLAYGRGEEVDDGPGGTGCLHLAQTIWNLLASLELDLRNGPLTKKL